MKSMVTPLTRVLPFRHPNGYNTLPFSLTRYPSSPNFSFSFSPLTLTLSMAASPQSSAPVPLSFSSFHPIEPYLACTLRNLNFASLDWSLEYIYFFVFACFLVCFYRVIEILKCSMIQSPLFFRWWLFLWKNNNICSIDGFWIRLCRLVMLTSTKMVYFNWFKLIRYYFGYRLSLISSIQSIWCELWRSWKLKYNFDVCVCDWLC